MLMNRKEKEGGLERRELNSMRKEFTVFNGQTCIQPFDSSLVVRADTNTSRSQVSPYRVSLRQLWERKKEIKNERERKRERERERERRRERLGN